MTSIQPFENPLSPKETWAQPKGPTVSASRGRLAELVSE